MPSRIPWELVFIGGTQLAGWTVCGAIAYAATRISDRLEQRRRRG
jgi:hypothetical protein